MLMLPAALFLAAASTAAECAKDPKNLLARSDCGFARGIQGWDSGSQGTISHDARDGAPTPGALKGVGTEGTLEAKGPCLPVKPNAKYRYGSRYRLGSGETYVCGMQVHHYGDAACQDGLGTLAAMADLVKPTWQAFDPARRAESRPDQNVATTEARTVAIRPVLVCGGVAGFSVLFDDVFVNPQ
jgi:hypothetical protein